MRANNLTLLTDLYELTMMQGYFKNPTNQTVIFDMFYRTNPCGGAFAITAGLEQMIEYIENLKFTDEDTSLVRWVLKIALHHSKFIKVCEQSKIISSHIYHLLII